MEDTIIILAGATGNLGRRVARELLNRGAKVRVLVRRSSAPDKVRAFRDQGAEIAEVDFNDHADLTEACRGGSCVVSTLSGLREIIVDTQTLLLEAAVKAGVPRFIPSDFSIDFTKLPGGTNRNLDLRREFRERLDQASITATSILNGMFTDLLTGEAPVILFKIRRVMYYETADQLMDFTTMDDTARFTAAAALDPSTPRFLRIAGDQISSRGLAEAAGAATGKPFRLLRAGSLKRLGRMIKFTRAVFPQPKAIYPPWQGMQYMYNMYTGLPKLDPLDNDRYPGLQWTTVKEFLSAR
ncbi:MAG: aromatic alcohol reductase [Thermodesulfobacteriota bacterium]